MDIHTIDIKQYSTSGSTLTESNIFHQKSLPLLSVVQSVEGSYGIGIDTKEQQQTGTMGAFIAPAEKMQYITHYTNPDTGVMQAHWIFLDVEVNRQYRLDDLFEFPILLPEKYQNALCDIIRKVIKDKNLCDNLSEIYKLVKILLEIGTPKEHINQFVHEIRLFVNQYYMEKISDDMLSKQLAMSKPTLYRKFKSYFHMTPANYINSIRLTKSIVLLENTNRTIYSICDAIGFSDAFYYSKLFKSKYGSSPSLYRKQSDDFHKKLSFS